MYGHGTRKLVIIYSETYARISLCNVAYVVENSFSFYVNRMFKLIPVLGEITVATLVQLVHFQVHFISTLALGLDLASYLFNSGKMTTF